MEFTRIEGYKGHFNGVGGPKLELDKDLLLESVFRNFSEKKKREKLSFGPRLLNFVYVRVGGLLPE